MTDDSLSRRMVFFAGATGALGVAAGAIGAHGLPDILERIGTDPDQIAKRLAQFDTAVRYHLIHAVSLLALAGVPYGSPKNRQWVSNCFLLGILLFSGSLYLLVFTGQTKLGMITPLGGLSWIVGWVLLAVLAKNSGDGYPDS